MKSVATALVQSSSLLPANAVGNTKTGDIFSVIGYR
jgi:hypothetical protein